MSPADRPWWATDGNGPSVDDADPLAAHRAARRGVADEAPPAEDAPPGDDTPRDDDPPPGGAAADDGSWWVPAAEAVTRLARDLAAGAVASPPRGLLDDDPPGEPGADGHRIDACGVCPICVGLRALGDARPELVGHLAEAARQLTLAVRTVVDAAAPADEAAGSSARGDGSRARRPADDLHRIDLDD